MHHRALISVFDKTYIGSVGLSLAKLGAMIPSMLRQWEALSTFLEGVDQHGLAALPDRRV
jgi:hypothetical protein